MTNLEQMRRAFLDDIVTSPADDAPRLIFADWLEEHAGRPEWAEFIRREVELAQQGWELNPNCHAYLKGRRDVLRALLWQGPHCHFDRGVVTNWKGYLATWLEHGEELLASYPLVRVGLIGKKPNISSASERQSGLLAGAHWRCGESQFRAEFELPAYVFGPGELADWKMFASENDAENWLTERLISLVRQPVEATI